MEEKIAMMSYGVAMGTVSAVSSASIPYLGVPLNVVGAAVAGAFCSFAFGDAVRPRARLFKLAIACALLGAGFISIAEVIFGFQVPPDKQAPLALVFSAVMRWVIPAFQRNVGVLIRRLAPNNEFGGGFNEPENRNEGNDNDRRFD